MVTTLIRQDNVVTYEPVESKNQILEFEKLPIEFEKYMVEVQIINRLRGIYGMCQKIIKKNPKKITTCNQFDLDTLGL